MSTKSSAIINSLLHRSFFAVFFIFMQVFAACAAVSIAERLGDLALCPFDVQIDEEVARIPKQIKQHTCRKSITKNSDTDDGGDATPKQLTCSDIGGHCVQVHETIKVSYRHRTLNHRKHDVKVNMSCVCVPYRGKPALPIVPNITR